MARNRKRAKERRARRPQPVPSTRREPDEAPDPLSHATPDVDLAEAQMALGRPELTEDQEPQAEENELEYELEANGDVPEEAEDDGAGGTGGGGGTLVAPGGPTPEARPEKVRPGSRLIHFLQGSWRELQRVQWPNRQQVVQATGVVIGFVIVAGVFLGIADWAAGKLVNYLLTGHF